VNRSVARLSAKHVAAKPVGCQGSNPQVSELSRFDDVIWDFSNEDQNPSVDKSAKRIRWDFETPRGGRFTDPAFEHLLLASKQFIYALRWHPLDGAPLAASAVLQLFSRTKRFLEHLLSYSNPILRFKDVLPHHGEDYIRSVLGSAFSRSYKYGLLQILQRLFHYREVMIDGLVMDPFQGQSVRKVVGHTHARQLETQTQAIPDEILGPLVRASLEYVDRFADYLLDTCEAVEHLRKRQRDFAYWSRRRVREHAPAGSGLEGSKFERGLSSVSQLNQELNYLQTACFVLIAFATGMRVSEILSLRVGCCETQKESGQQDLVWLRSRVFKMQGLPEGRRAKWLGGSVCARAVRVLERLGRRVRRQAKASFLWLPLLHFHRAREPHPLIAMTIGHRLRRFIAMLGLRDTGGRPFHLHPHMFRRTFARHVARHDTTNLLALKEHFKHASLWMTDYYVGSDLELWTLMMEEEEKLFFESFDKALRAEHLAGPGGVHLRKRIDEAIADGRLPREFRGEAGSHLRREMIRNLVESGQRVYPCAASNYCWFRPESALCTEGYQPLLKRCNPGACTNSIVTPEHKPHWEKVQRDCVELMELKPQAEPYQKALQDIHAVSHKILQDLT
jgi:integrase